MTAAATLELTVTAKEMVVDCTNRCRLIRSSNAFQFLTCLDAAVDGCI